MGYVLHSSLFYSEALWFSVTCRKDDAMNGPLIWHDRKIHLECSNPTQSYPLPAIHRLHSLSTILTTTPPGFPFAFGVFQTYYSTNPLFAPSTTGIAAIGTTSTGIMYLASPLAFLFVQRYPHLRRKTSWVAFAILLASLVAASFATTVPQLIATQGVMYAVGGVVLYFPAIQVLDEWFVRRKGLAFGVMWAGTGASGVVFPFVLEWLLDTYGYGTALRIWAVFSVCAALPSLPPFIFRLPVLFSFP